MADYVTARARSHPMPPYQARGHSCRLRSARLPDVVPRARELGVIVVQNPSHFAFVDILTSRHGAPHSYQPARSLIEAGIPFALGSDGPLNPFLNLLFATTHPAQPSEALTMEQA